jgi:hypothetical protein
MDDSLRLVEGRLTAGIAAMTIRVRPHKPEHRDDRGHALRAVVTMQAELPKLALAIQDPHDIAEGSLVLSWGHDRDQACLDGLDRMIPRIRGIRVTPIGSGPCLLQLQTKDL